MRPTINRSKTQSAYYIVRSNGLIRTGEFGLPVLEPPNLNCSGVGLGDRVIDLAEIETLRLSANFRGTRL